MKRPSLLLLVLFAGVFVLAACGDDDSTTQVSSGDNALDDSASSDTSDEQPDDTTEPTIEEIGDPGFVEGGATGATATLTVGNQEWVFTSALCAFGEDQIGQEGAVWNMSATEDGMQMYATIDSFGQSVSLNDIENFENPSVSIEASGGEFIQIDGKTVTAEAEFTDDLTGETATGTFSVTCP
jgi:hypothetical protein